MLHTADNVNLQSLAIVRDELVATIENSARHLELYIRSPEESSELDECINGIRQIIGILKLIEFGGALMLAEELLNCAQLTPEKAEKPGFNRYLEVVSSSFFVMTRYFEYVQSNEYKAPVLLIPHINELRKLQQKLTLPECHFFEMQTVTEMDVSPVASAEIRNDAQQVKEIRRLRHMYQVGLLGLIRGQQTPNAIALMRRALNRLFQMCGEVHKLRGLWWLANLTLKVLVDKQMSPLDTRKALFSRIDRVIAQTEKAPVQAFSSEPPKGLIKELVYLICLSDTELDDARQVIEHYKVAAFPYTDAILEKERKHMHGPSAHTVTSLASVLKVELGGLKKTLEQASQASTQRIEDIDGFISTLEKITEIFLIIGLQSSANTLKEEVERAKRWAAENGEIDLIEMQEVANTLLYLESMLSSVSFTKLSEETIDKASKVAQRQVITLGELDEAKKIVIAEGLAGLSLVKRALSSFADSNYDSGHIRNIIKTLDTIRGGMLMLGHNRAVMVLSRSKAFVQEVLLAQDPHPAIKEFLETFADAIISIEYYLNSTSGGADLDHSILKIAEESLDALGFPVEEQV